MYQVVNEKNAQTEQNDEYIYQIREKRSGIGANKSKAKEFFIFNF